MSHDSFGDENIEAKILQLQQKAASRELSERADALEELASLKFEQPDVTPRDTMPYVSAALELALQLERHPEVVELRYMLASLHSMVEETELAQAEAVEALRLGHEHFVAAHRSELTKMLARIERRNGNLALALDYLAQSFEAAEDNGLEFWTAFGALMNSSHILGQMDLLDEALEKTEQAYAYALKTQISPAIADALNEKAWLLFRLGAADELPDVLERLEAHVDTISQPWTRDFAEINACAFEIMSDPTPVTLGRLDALHASARERWNGPATVAMVQYLRAQYFAATGDTEEALKLLRKVNILRESDVISRFSAYHLHLTGAHMAVADGRFDQAVDLLRQAIDSCPIGDDGTSVNELRVWLAELELQSGQAAAALGDLEAVPRDAWQPTEASWMRQSRLLAKTLGSLQRHTETLMVANEILSAVYGSEGDQQTKHIAAEMHELKARSLAALGEGERSRSEFEQARDAYAGADDFASMARVAKALSSGQPMVESRESEERFW